jgi:hypothetical protein
MLVSSALSCANVRITDTSEAAEAQLAARRSSLRLLTRPGRAENFPQSMEIGDLTGIPGRIYL